MASASQAVLTVSGLEVSYLRSPKRFAYPDITVERGQCVCISGSTGCGKTTLLNSLFQPAFRGEVNYKEARLLVKDVRSYGPAIYRVMSYMPQYAQDGLNPMMDVGAQIQAVLEGNGLELSSPELEKNLGRLGLNPDILKLFPHQMSGGMKQRLVLLMAYLKKAALMVLDEPSSAIDALTLRSMLDFLKEIKSEGIALVIVSHDLGFTRHIADISIMLESC